MEPDYIDYYNELQIEKRKLDSLVDEALQSGTPISETYAIMAQCAKIKRLSRDISDALQGSDLQAQSRRVDNILTKLEGDG